MRISISTFILFVANTVSSQSPVADFTIPANSCIGEQVSFVNNSTNSVSYEWDFCIDKFSDNLTIDYLNDITGGERNVGIDFIEVSGRWYGVATSIIDHKLQRLTFGNGLSNPATLVETLNNPDNVLNQPVSIGLVEQNGIIYALVHNWAGSLVKVSFNDGIAGNSQSGSIVYASFGGSVSKMEVINTTSELKAVVVNTTASIEIIDFQNDINRTIQGTDITTEVLVGVSNPREIEIVNFEGNWYAFIAEYSSGKIVRVDFGTDFTTGIKNIQLDVTSNIYNSGNPNNIEITQDGNNFILHVLTFQGELYKVDLGNDITTSGITGGSVQYGSNDSYDQGYTMKFLKDKGDWHGFIVNDINTKLYHISNPTVCPASIRYSEEIGPSLSFSQAGNYDIRLTAFDNLGNNDFITKSISITSSQAPIIDFNIGTNQCITLPVSFTATSDQPITTWNWNFGDGFGTSNLQNANYTYGSAGEYQVRLSVTNANGCDNFLIDTVQVYEEPVPSFTVPVGNLCMNNEILFTNTTTGETGNPVTWTWDFNGEGSSSEKEPNFTFLMAGSKTITLTSSIPGCANVIQKTINIEEAPTTAFSFNNGCNSQTTTFTDETTGSNLTTWNWNFGDGNNSTNQSPTHNYLVPGKYVVTLSVSNNLGCITTKVDTVYNHDNPVVNFTNDLACSTSPIQFTDQSLVANANLVAWEWGFGDGSTSTDQHPTHLYNQTGDFTVMLKAYSQYGCVDSIETAITVAQGPQVDFEWDKACQGESTTFTDLTNSFGVSITNWNWIVDGTLLTNQNPTYTFTNSGTYTVQLSVTINNLCAQTYPQDITVKIPPTVLFDYSEDCGSAGTTFYDLTDQMDDAIIAREWWVDSEKLDTDPSSDSIATTQLDPGTYAITLSVITSAGCEESTTSNVSLVGSPLAAFEVNTIYGAAPLEVNFSNLSTGGSTYHWSFGDLKDSMSTEQNPTFTYDAIGLYTITLRTSSDTSCYDETTQQIEVVEAESSAEIIAITPGTTNDITNFVITIENSGTNIIDNRSNLVFRADYGTEVIEPINAIIYAGKTINYSASYAIPSNSNTSSICVELVDYEDNQLDRSCVNINSSIHISEPYPNPSKGFITVDVMLENTSAIKVRVINRSGQPVLTQSFDGSKGLNKLLIDAQALPQGLYIIEVNSGDRTEQFKTSIIR